MQMTKPIESANTYTDFKGLTELKKAAKENSPEALRAVAQQFEALFLQQMLKGMRDASLGEGLLDSKAGDMYQDMFDKQISLNMSQGKGIGIADMLVRQLSDTVDQIDQINSLSEKTLSKKTMFPQNTTFSTPNPVRSRPIQSEQVEKIATDPGNKTAETKVIRFTGPESFVKNLWPLAVQAGNELGVDPKVILAQAALETGWGSAIKQTTNGTSSHNLFNIKAGSKWTGNTVAVNADEIINNQAVKEMSHFRAYESHADSFSDYVALLKNNSRYYNVLKQANDSFAYVKGLQDAGYATDPQYAEKIMKIVDSNKIENSLTNLKISLHRPITE